MAEKRGIKSLAWMMLIVAEFTVIFCLIPSEYINKNIKSEYQQLVSQMGKEYTDQILNLTNVRFKEQLVDSGILSSVKNHLLIDKTKPEQELKGTDWWFTYIEDRIKAVSAAYYQFLMRIGIVEKWMPYFLLILIPSVYDGIMTWKISRVTYKYASPLMHKLSTSASFWIIGISLMLFMSPFVLPPAFIPASILLFCSLLGVLVANRQKRI